MALWDYSVMYLSKYCFKYVGTYGSMGGHKTVRQYVRQYGTPIDCWLFAEHIIEELRENNQQKRLRPEVAREPLISFNPSN
jgi:hypothetical protein